MEPFVLTESFFNPQVPYRFEADVYDCEVVGTIPSALNGYYYRVGGDDAYPTLPGDNVINADGMFSMFHFEDGNVDFRLRYVKTERYLAERKARRRLFGKYRNPYTDDPSTAGINRDNTGNTYAFFHHGRLFALREDSIPHEIDPRTLETRAVADFGEALTSKTMTAHPKIDPVTGEWWSFGLFSQKNYEGEMALQVFDREGRLVRHEEFMTPYPGLAHDFAVTREHVIFPIMPLTVDVERVKRGGDFYAYDHRLRPMYGVMPRSGTAADMRWFEVPQGFAGHFMNAYSEGSLVHVDGAISPGNSFPFYGDVDGNPTDRQQGFATISRVTLDLASNDDKATLTPFPGASGEMPRIDDRFAMTKYRYGFTMAPDGIVKLDWQTGERIVHALPEPGSAQEPVFVPRSPDAPEGDGYILCAVNRRAENRADLLILDTMRMEDAPIATVKLPFNLHMSFHGMFVPEAALPAD